ncbi:MAG: 4-alpha-glucanotransferase [Pseudomonadota bacterium]
MNKRLAHPLGQRSAGVLLHITSLPSPWGIGDIGPEARSFASRLQASGQSIWQLLPLNPTSGAAGDSPYFSNAGQAGNTLLLSPDDLVADGLLDPGELPSPVADSCLQGDFSIARTIKTPLVRLAAQRVVERRDSQFRNYCEQQSAWLEDYALYVSLVEQHNSGWHRWPEALKRREPEALARAREELDPLIMCAKAEQFLFDLQWRRLQAHCDHCSVSLFGDLPIYVNRDSVDVWAAPKTFQLDDDLLPSLEAGVPPDYFSETGQLWRNPVYNWQSLSEQRFRWWLDRLSRQLSRLDLLRIDHFRGLVKYWAVRAGSENAIQGQWMDVPTEALLAEVCATFEPLPLVAEDLGTITDDVREIRDRYGIPGMLVLQFAFGDDHHDNPYKPQNHRENAIAYLGTHDNNTTRGWLEHELDDAARHRLSEWVPDSTGESGVRACVELLLSSPANTAIVTAQDLLALGPEARMNTPGQAEGNWRWRLTPEQCSALPLDWLCDRCTAHNR